jgi:flagellar basal body-associated protein FliL
MVDEIITERTDENGHVVERVIERTNNVQPAPERGSTSTIFAIVMLVAIIVGSVMWMSASKSRNAKDAAITGAANDVGKAAEKAGNAIEKAADKLIK